MEVISSWGRTEAMGINEIHQGKYAMKRDDPRQYFGNTNKGIEGKMRQSLGENGSKMVEKIQERERKE